MSRGVERSLRNGRLAAPLAFLLLLLAGFASLVAASAQAGLEPLDFVTASGTHRFMVEVMRTPEQLERGLMFRRYMPPDRGMLFDFQIEQPVMMWMKNTYLPLDMVFISRNAVVKSIAKNAEPLSERIIPSNGAVFAVVELNAGTADRIELKPGDRVVQALFRR